MIPQPRRVSIDGGDVVGVYDYGDPDGTPVLVLHGAPACGAGFEWADEPARARGLRLIAPDRPGVGLSTPGALTAVGDYAAHTERLVDALGIDRFSVWGYSGGGPYAVAIAAGLPTRVTALAVAAGMGEVGAWATIDDFEKTDRQLVTLSTKHPALARVALGTMGRLARLSPKTAMRSFVKELSESDRRVIDGLGDPASAMALFTQAFLVSSRGVVDDYRTLGRRWEVDFDAIVVPTRIFQGTDDTMVPARHSTELALMITGAEVVEWPGEGHLGTIAHVDEILEWLASFSPDGAGG